MLQNGFTTLNGEPKHGIRHMYSYCLPAVIARLLQTADDSRVQRGLLLRLCQVLAGLLAGWPNLHLTLSCRLPHLPTTHQRLQGL